MKSFLQLVLLSYMFLLLIQPNVTGADEPDCGPTLSVLHRTTKPLLKADRPWESFCIGYCSVARIGNDWHLWYDAYDSRYRDDNDCYTCYAHSNDGIHWEKPSLGICSYQGSKKNNILGFGTHGFMVFYDKQAPESERFKGVGVRMKPGHSKWWIYGATSADGIHWKWQPEPLLNKNADTANVCIHDGNVYRFYVRMWSGGKSFSGQRIIGYSESDHFGDFSDPMIILVANENHPSKMQFYNPATKKLADQQYFMFPSGLFPDGSLSVYSAFSRDGKQFCCRDQKPLLKTGKGFDNRGMYLGEGAIPGEVPNTYWIYYLGVSVSHDDNCPSNVRYGGGVGRFLLKINE